MNEKYPNTTFTNFDKNIEGLEISGCNGFCYDENFNFAIVYGDGKDYWTLPGGGIEVGETSLECFIREVKEEIQCDVSNVELVFALEVKTVIDGVVTEHKQQHRYLAKCENIKEFVPNLNGFEIEERKFVTLEEMQELIPWLKDYENGREIIEAVKMKLNI